MIRVCNITLNAQQKPSSRDMMEERKKFNEKKAARNAYVSKMRASMPIESHATPATPALNQQSGTGGNPGSATTNPTPANLKPSQQPMKIPKKPTVIKQ